MCGFIRPLNKLYKDEKILLLAFALTLISTGSFTQSIDFPMLDGFKKETNYPVYTPDNLWDFINGAADNYLAYDFVDLHVAEYKKERMSSRSRHIVTAVPPLPLDIFHRAFPFIQVC